jgi:hypothetical protein
MREQFISVALQQRLTEVLAHRSRALFPNRFDGSLFVSQVRDQLLEAANQGNISVRYPPEWSEHNVWMESDLDCLASLRYLSLGRSLQLREGPRASLVAEFVEVLEANRRDGQQCFQLLSERYKCPLNIALASEKDVVEYLLKRLMVQDRLLVEKHSLRVPENGYLLLKLNLLAIAAALVDDLRYLDALNYYYEKLPASWSPQGPDGWLLASYLGLYARALTTHL